MHHTWGNYPIEVSQNSIDRLARFRWLVRDFLQDRARFLVRRNRPVIDVFPIVGDPICKPVKLLAKEIGWNIA
jgi:hypothetical protein